MLYANSVKHKEGKLDLKFSARILLMLLAILAMATMMMPAEASTTGIISGIVVDSETGTKLSGVNIVIKGTNLTTVTDSKGYFVITNVPREPIRW